MKVSNALYGAESEICALEIADNPKNVRIIAERYIRDKAKHIDYLGTKRVLYSLNVYCFPVLEVEYIYHDKSYVVWIFGNSKTIFAEKTPNVVSDKLSGFGKKLKGFLKRSKKES